jgi:acyl transferase domain-containing protein
MTTFLERTPQAPVRECCYTINVSRSHHRVRCSGVVADRAALLEFFRAAHQARHLEAIPAKPRLYVCNCDSLVEQATAEALRTDRRFPVFRARFDDLLPRLIDGASVTPEEPVTRAFRTVAFEAAFYWQLQAWGIRFERATGTGLGRLVSRLVAPPAATNELVAAVRAAVRATMAQVGEGADPIVALASPDDEEAVESSDSHTATAYTVYRRVPPLTNATTGTAARGPSAISEGGQLSAHDVLMFLARHLSAGGEVDWVSYYGAEPTATISLPTYPFSRDRHWLDD